MSGPFGSSQWMYNSGDNFYNGIATQSVRLDDGSSAYLSRTPSSAGNRQTWVISFWIKRSTISTNQGLWSTYNGTGTINTQSSFRAADDKLDFYDNDGSYKWNLVTTQAFRDTSAWYHLVYAVDTTQATASDRVKLYVNGTQITAFDTATYPSLNFSGADWNNNVIQFIGKHSSNYFDGYIAEFNNIDGLSFFSDTSGTPNTSFNINSFGETKNGVWIAKKYTGSYGTNGFRLQFNQTGTGTASSSTIGADTSGNNNHWTSSGIVASDCNMPDSPENNFATLNSIQNQTSATLSEGNLKAVGTSANWDNLQSTFAVSSGKWYWEVKATSVSEANSFVAGIHQTGFSAQSLFWFSGSYTTSAYGTAFGVLDPDNKVTNGSATAFTLGLATNDIIQFRLNLDDNELSVSIDGSDKGKIYDITANIEYTPALCLYNTSSATMNFGQDSTFAGTETAGGNADENGNGDFAYAPPSGYLALCTANLPEPTISPNADTQADDYFTPTLYTSDNIGAGGTQSITGLGFQPDWVWIKNRSSGSTSHTLFDSVRTAGKMLQSDNTSAEASNSQYGYLSSFDSDGFTLTGGTTNANFINQGTDAYVSWNWKAGGTAVSNEQGSITSSVSANTDAGFSIVTYTGTRTSDAGETGTPTTIGHGLGKKPAVVITKAREAGGTTRWNVWHQGYQPDQTYLNYQLWLNETSGANNAGWQRTDTGFSTTTFCPARYSWDDVSGTDYVAYCFAEIDGYSKFGTYTGNGSTDGTYIYLGFKPAFLMYKRADTTGNWLMDDNKTSTFNYDSNYLLAENPDAEGDTTTNTAGHMFDHLSNGFKMRNTNSARNANGGTYIYMAFAKNPFKYSTGR